MQARPMPSCGVRLSVRLTVCLSVTFVTSANKNKRIFKIFLPSGSHTILVFPQQTSWRYSDGDPLTGASNAGEVGRNRDSEPISGFTVCCQCCDRPGVINTVPPDGGKLWHLPLVVSGGVDYGRRRRNVYDKKPRHYAKDNRTAHLTARSDKSVTYVTNDKRLYSTFCTVEANY